MVNIVLQGSTVAKMQRRKQRGKVSLGRPESALIKGSESSSIVSEGVGDTEILQISAKLLCSGLDCSCSIGTEKKHTRTVTTASMVLPILTIKQQERKAIGLSNATQCVFYSSLRTDGKKLECPRHG